MAPASTTMLGVLLSISRLIKFQLVLILIPLVAGRVKMLALLGSRHRNRIPAVSLLYCRTYVELFTHIPVSLVSHLQNKIGKENNIQIKLAEQVVKISPSQILDGILHRIWRLFVSWN